ncbi:CHC2 zinc finger domain-containing protein [Hippea alviniae]|uniref:CHC2 zinc finger domain-containing protein n=1 Tax=Hippea alviniae TaxID=1279027 RepID=UPI0003B35A8D|nr:CHC2 zinc finger domain-containing protein [Hippea alviniae]
MNLLNLLEQDGFNPKRVASTDGGEYACPCPFCGGEDRFRVWPEKDRFWCRQCNAKGDSIEYLKKAKGLSFKEACSYLNISPALHTNKQNKQKSKTVSNIKAWQEKAMNFVKKSQEYLWQNAFALEFLENERFLKRETIKHFRLGFNPFNIFESAANWGLKDRNRVFLPKGVVIPIFKDNQILRVKIRRFNETPKYKAFAGSNMQPVIFEKSVDCVIVVESELDGMLLWQETNCSILALGSVAIFPDDKILKTLKRAKHVIILLDYDKPGIEKVLNLWLKHFRYATWLVPPIGKDPTECFAKGVQFEDWLPSYAFAPARKEIYTVCDKEEIDRRENFRMPMIEKLSETLNNGQSYITLKGIWQGRKADALRLRTVLFNKHLKITTLEKLYDAIINTNNQVQDRVKDNGLDVFENPF